MEPVSYTHLKYLLLLFFCLLGGAAALGVGALSGALGQPVNWPEQLTFVALLLCVAIIFSSIALPLLYKFGAERARLLLVMCYLLPIAAIMLLGKILPAYVPVSYTHLWVQDGRDDSVERDAHLVKRRQDP